ncbi:OsmC family protein [Granulosicoccaceae sp. 1_MG-2023]|nr:OsmC family protein [Granulosicoccaceae sp. 1_MG-2023]
MQAYPHKYQVTSEGAAQGNVELTSPGLQSLTTAPPPQFGGPEGIWSPETLFAASVADCYILSFRAVTQMKKFDWIAIRCETDAILDKPERLPMFTRLDLRVTLTVAAGTDKAEAEKLLQRAKDICLVTNSMTAEKTLTTEIVEA